MKKINNIRLRPDTMDAGVAKDMQRNVYHAAEYVRDGDFVIDAGAYIGAFALFVKHLCPGAQVLCLEPMPSNFAVLKRNAGKMAILEQIALVGKPGTVTLYDFGPTASALHSIYDLGVDGAVPVSVPGETLSQVMKRHRLNNLRFLKLDCQGAEYEIISNTPHAILDKIDYIAMEVHRSIARAGAVLGAIPDYKVKMSHLYQHLLKTHLPIHGGLKGDWVQVWTNRKLVSPGAQIWFKLLYPYFRFSSATRNTILDGLLWWKYRR